MRSCSTGGMASKKVCLLFTIVVASMVLDGECSHDYADALHKSLLFFEGQRSGKLPSDQRLKWRKDSALSDGDSAGVDLVGGYYDAGDNLKFGFPMAFTVTVLAWSIVDFGELMGSELEHTRAAIRWGTDYLLKATSVPNVVYVQVGEPYLDHNCWERPEDMDTPRNVYAVDKDHPGSEVAAETAAALAAASMVFKSSDPSYSRRLLKMATKVFAFADKYRGSYSESLGSSVCPFYCDFSGYEDELIWGALWLSKASGKKRYQKYVVKHIRKLNSNKTEGHKRGGVEEQLLSKSGEFGWDDKRGGVNVILAKDLLKRKGRRPGADKIVCGVLPESPTRNVEYSPGGLIFKEGGGNMQNPVSVAFLMLVYGIYLKQANEVVHCGTVTADSSRLIQLAKTQVDYILGDNPLKMSYMVGYGNKFPQRIHHRGSSLPSVDQHPQHIECKEGTPFYLSKGSNPNLLIGAVVGGHNKSDGFRDSRAFFQESEPCTYINAPLVGLLAYFTAHPN